MENLQTILKTLERLDKSGILLNWTVESVIDEIKEQKVTLPLLKAQSELVKILLPHPFSNFELSR